MAAHSHDQHYTETKPVAFTVPFILAAVVILAIGLFLSLCDPEPHGRHNAAAGHEAAAGTHHEATTPGTHQDATAEGTTHH